MIGSGEEAELVNNLASVVVDARNVTAPLLGERDERRRAWVVKGGGD